MIITGGANNEAGTSVEVFNIDSGHKCILPQLPDQRYWHTQVIFDNIVSICIKIISLEWKHGGYDTPYTCLQLVDGDWITSHHLQTERESHTSWTTTDGVLLIGGWDQVQSTELVKTDGTTEVGTLQLKYYSR